MRERRDEEVKLEIRFTFNEEGERAPMDEEINEGRERPNSVYKSVYYSHNDPRVENERLKPIQWPKSCQHIKIKHI